VLSPRVDCGGVASAAVAVLDVWFDTTSCCDNDDDDDDDGMGFTPPIIAFDAPAFALAAKTADTCRAATPIVDGVSGNVDAVDVDNDDDACGA
jgi:hypothetical protein